MKIPKQLKIGGHTVKVVLTELEGRCGEYESRTNTIRIDSSQAKSQAEAALLHEIVHALNHTFGDTNLGHALLDSLTEQLYQVLSDNKLLK